MLDIRQLMQEAERRRSTVIDSAFGPIPSSVVYLEGLLQHTPFMEDKQLLFSLLPVECALGGNRAAEVHFLRRQLDELPLQPVFLTMLANSLADDPDSVPEALQRCEEAIRMARRDHRQIRYCLTIQARLALDLGDYDLLSEALRSLVDDVGNRRADDTAFDFDFLDRIDESRIDANLLRQYRALATVRI